LPFERNSNVFHFDTEIIIQLAIAGKRVREMPIPTYYGDEICYVNGLRYAVDVLKATLQARLQRVQIFYDRRFDCATEVAGQRYPSKLKFDSSHSRVLQLIPENASVLDLGSGTGAVGAALRRLKACTVVGCDMEPGAYTCDFDEFLICDLDAGLPDLAGRRFDYILALDVIEHLASPENFLDQLRVLADRTGARVILTTANIAFVLMRLLLLLGRFEYGKRGILDLTHRRLFTFNTFRRAVMAASLDIETSEGVPVPVAFVFSNPLLSRSLGLVNRLLAYVLPKLFGFQILLIARPRPTLESLRNSATSTAAEKLRRPMLQIEGDPHQRKSA
jgi:2-polyprenyl-3-methyl-5-hydroxy-6-metoxy-1,4-benzoquinol methylase